MGSLIQDLVPSSSERASSVGWPWGGMSDMNQATETFKGICTALELDLTGKSGGLCAARLSLIKLKHTFKTLCLDPICIHVEGKGIMKICRFSN